MELSFKELKKREVINMADGKCLGNITDLTLSFPSGMFTGITVPGKKLNCLLKIFSKSEMFIERSKIIKIGSDVILVDLKCGDVCAPSVPANRKPNPPCNPFCGNNQGGNLGSSGAENIDLGDY